MIRVTLLPAKRGDSLLVEYGDGVDMHRILVDCGFKGTYADEVKPALEALDTDLELLIVTHVDLDHVNGVLSLFEDTDRVDIADVWFNAFEHLEGKRVVPDLQSFGGAQGEELSLQLRTQQQPWNVAFDGEPVVTGSGPLPLPGGATMTLLSPTQAQLTALIPKWEAECAKAGLKPGVDAEEPKTIPGFESFGAVTSAEVDALAAKPFDADDSESNGATISFVLEHGGKRILLSGDADARQLFTALQPLAAAEGGTYRLDALQVPHHGSKANLSPALLELIDCPLYLVSTNGSTFRHPSDETIARIAKFGGAAKTVAFNYADRGTKWTSQSLVDDFGMNTQVPPAATDGTLVMEI